MEQITGWAERMATISIIIPTYNAASTLEETLSSIRSQTYCDYELIIVDGQSSDNTLGIAAKNRDIIKVLISEKDKGIYDAMNKGIKVAKGAHILFLGADDTLYDLKVLEDIVPRLSAGKVYYGQAYFTNRQKVYDGRFSLFKMSLRNICHQAIFYPSEVIRKFGFDLGYPLLADYHLNLLLLGKGVKFIYIDRIVANFNDAASSACNTDWAFEKDKLALIRTHIGYVYYLYAASRRVIKRGLNRR